MIAVWSAAAPHLSAALAELDAAHASYVVLPVELDAAAIAEAATARVQLVGGGPVTREVIGRLTETELIVRAGVGTDKIDLASTREHGITVANITDYCIDEVADHAMTLLLAGWRHLSDFRDQAAGNWHTVTQPPVRRLRGSTLGLLGLGRIGAAVATRAAAFGLDVIAHDPLAAELGSQGTAATFVDLPEFFAQSDIISLHVPLTVETHHLIGQSAFAAMRRSPVLINTARGALIDTDALERALDTGLISGAFVDTLEGEPDISAHAALLRRSDVIITPHIGWYSHEALVDLGAHAARAALDYETTGTLPRTVVSAPPIPVEAG